MTGRVALNTGVGGQDGGYSAELPVEKDDEADLQDLAANGSELVSARN